VLKRGWANIASLALAQAFNAITPIVVFPKLLHELGSEKYATFVFAESLSFIILTAVLFGFEISGVKLVAQAFHNGDRERMREVFSDILYTRSLIFAFCVLVVVAGFLATNSTAMLVLICWCLVPLGYLLQSTFYFLGTENSFPIAVFTAISRSLLLGGVFVYANASWPSYFPALLIGISYAATGGLCLLSAYRDLGWRLESPSWMRIRSLVRDGWNIFTGNMFVMLLKDTPIIYLKFLGFSPEAISSYSLADKGIKALQASMRPLNQHFFSVTVKRFRADDRPNRETLNALMKGTWPQVFAVSALILLVLIGWTFFGKDLVQRFGLPAEFDRSMGLLFVMLPSAVIGVFNFMAGAAGLSSLNASRQMASTLATAALVSSLSLIALAFLFGLPGAAFNVVLGELVLAVLVFRAYVGQKRS